MKGGLMKPNELQILKIGSIVIGCIIAMAALIYAIQWTIINDRIQRHYVSQKYHAAKIHNQKIELYNKKLEAYKLTTPDCIDIKNLTADLDKALDEYNNEINKIERKNYERINQ